MLSVGGGVFQIHASCVGAGTRRELWGLQWEVFGRPPNKPELVPNGCHLFLGLESVWVEGSLLAMVQRVGWSWLRSLAADDSTIGVERLVSCCGGCLGGRGDCVEGGIGFCDCVGGVLC